MLIFRALLAVVGGPSGGGGIGVVGSSLGSRYGGGGSSPGSGLGLGVTQNGPAMLAGTNVVIPVAVLAQGTRRALQMERAAGLSGSL